MFKAPPKIVTLEATTSDCYFRHLDGTLKAVKYHGQKRKDLVPMMEETDIVLTTYHTLVADFGEKSSPLHEIEWFRVVLDEGKRISKDEKY